MCSWLGSLVTQTVKNLPAMQETQVPFLGRARPLEKGMVTSSNTLAWRVPWIEEPGGLQSSGSQRVGPDLSVGHVVSFSEFHVGRCRIFFCPSLAVFTWSSGEGLA